MEDEEYNENYLQNKAKEEEDEAEEETISKRKAELEKDIISTGEVLTQLENYRTPAKPRRHQERIR